MVESSRIGRPSSSSDARIDAAEVRVRRRPHDQLAGVGAAELLAGEVAVADVGELLRELEPGELVVGAPLRRRHLGQALRCSTVSEPAALMPAPSVIATIASATSTSISVKPRAACLSPRGTVVVADGERPDAVGRERQPLVVEAQHDALRADQRLGAEHDGARADHLRRRAGVEPVRRQRRSRRRGRRSESRCRRPARRAAPSAPRRPMRAPRRAPIRAATRAASPRARASAAAGSRKRQARPPPSRSR